MKSETTSLETLMVKSVACRKSRVGRADDVARQVLVGSRCKMETVHCGDWCMPVRHPSAQSKTGTRLCTLNFRPTFDLRHATDFTD